MSKVLKVIVNLFLVCAILIAAAILVPPLLGVSTTVIDSSSTETNLSVGSVTYSKDENIADIVAGDKILHESDARVYAYKIQAVDADSSKYTVVDYKSGGTETQELTLRNTASKIIVSVPLIGYIMIAMHSVEGLIIIGLIVLFIIILFILAELWKKSDDNDEEDQDEEEDEEQIAVNPPVQLEEERALEQAQEELAKAMAEENQPQTEEVQQETEIQADAQPKESAFFEQPKEVESPETEQPQEEQPAVEVYPEAEKVMEDKESFVPVARASAEELLKRAEEAGEQPEILKDENLGITILDYTNII